MTQENEKQTKVCTKCKRELPKTMFSIKTAAKDGLQSCCKECQHDYWQKRLKKKDESPLEPRAAVNPNNRPLVGFHVREIVAELRFRGYTGKLYLTRSLEV